jgi:hypothetical protein
VLPPLQACEVFLQRSMSRTSHTAFGHLHIPTFPITPSILFPTGSLPFASQRHHRKAAPLTTQGAHHGQEPGCTQRNQKKASENHERKAGREKRQKIAEGIRAQSVNTRVDEAEGNAPSSTLRRFPSASANLTSTTSREIRCSPIY